MRQNRPKDKSQSGEQDYSDVLELVEQLAEVLNREGLTEVRVRDNELEVQVSRYRGNPDGYERASAPQATETGVAVGTPHLPGENVDVEVDGDGQGAYISAPMPSRFYRAPAPDEPPFVQVGDTVNTGEPVGMLEVMKTYNPVEAPFNCEILEILAEDGEAVEYSQLLFRVKQL
jgi:acetyl-CoA carboxylase biotin carboxyl carrier protein